MNSPALVRSPAARIPNSTTLRVAAATDTGLVREKNDDSFVVADLTPDASPLSARMNVGPQGILLAVADGMGGHADGDVASRIAVDTLLAAMRASNGIEPERIERAVLEAHLAVCAASGNAAGSLRMGTTLTAVHVDGMKAHIAHVGDSRAYLVRAGGIAQLTKDQTLTELLIDSGLLEPSQRMLSPFAHQLAQALGQSRLPLSIATSTLELREADVLVLCSDGLTNMLDDEEIAAAVREQGPFEETARMLVDLANLRGGDDNTTVIVAGARGRLPRPSATETIASTHTIVQSYRRIRP